MSPGPPRPHSIYLLRVTAPNSGFHGHSCPSGPPQETQLLATCSSQGFALVITPTLLSDPPPGSGPPTQATWGQLPTLLQTGSKETATSLLPNDVLCLSLDNSSFKSLRIVALKNKTLSRNTARAEAASRAHLREPKGRGCSFPARCPQAGCLCRANKGTLFGGSGSAFSIRIRVLGRRPGGDALQTFLFSLVDGNNIYFAVHTPAL